MAKKKKNDIPPGLTLRHTLRGHESTIYQIAWSPDGRVIASPSKDTAIRLWDVETGAVLRILGEHIHNVFSIAWSPDGRMLASGSGDQTIRLWDVETGRLLRRLEGHTGEVGGVAWSPDGHKLASGSSDDTVRLWDVETGRLLRALEEHSSLVRSVAWSPDGHKLASGSYDDTVRLWDVETGRLLHTLKGHTADVIHVTWSPNGQWLASGSEDRTIRLWDTETGRQINVLEGHADEVISVSFSPDGQLLATKGDIADSTVRLWRCDIWETVAKLHEPTSGSYLHGLDFHPNSSALATLGEKDTVIRIWDLDLEILLGQAPAVPSVHHTTAKIVLVGDSGVGKTGLGWRLAHDEFIEHPSTHGQQFWVLDQLKAKREKDGTECEAVLWDLAGQPDYRLIHSLFLDDAELALVLFDPTDRKDPLSGVDYWLKALSHRPSGSCRCILVGARTDRGDATLTQEDIDAFCRDRGITGGYVSTSALTAAGLDELLAQVKGQIVWDEMTTTTTTQTFKRIKDYVLGLKEDQEQKGVLASPTELRGRLQALDEAWAFTDAEMMTAVGHLAKYGYVRVLRTTSGEQNILLAPNVLNNLASSFVLEARRNPKGLGALDEERVLSNDYRFPELADLDEAEQNILLDAVTVLFIDHTICFREKHGNTTYLIFPELINQKKPRVEGEVETVEDVSYTVAGSVENVYAALVVLLGYTSIFTRTNQWQNQAQYEVGPEEVCGFRQLEEREGEIDVVLYYAASVGPPTRLLFQGLFERFLAGRSVAVTRFPALVCGECGYTQDRTSIVRRIRAGKNFIICVECGERIVLPEAVEVVLSETQRRVVDQQQAVAALRTRFEAALVQVNSFIGDREGPSCFISYAWGKPEHERWVEKSLARDLEKAGIGVILDRWDNAKVGANIARFIELIQEADATLVVGTPLYLKKYKNEKGHVAAAEADLIQQRLIDTEEEKQTVLPVLLEGTQKTAFPPLMRGKVYADFRGEEIYFTTLFDLILSLYGIDFRDRAVADLRETLRPGRMG